MYNKPIWLRMCKFSIAIIDKKFSSFFLPDILSILSYWKIIVQYMPIVLQIPTSVKKNNLIISVLKSEYICESLNKFQSVMWCTLLHYIHIHHYVFCFHNLWFIWT